jgi:hypothetical protein
LIDPDSKKGEAKHQNSKKEVKPIKADSKNNFYKPKQRSTDENK